MRAKNGSETKSIADVRPDLIAEWDFERNAPDTPDNVAYACHKKYWWICPENKDHKYDANPKNRILAGSMCPFCAGRKTHPSNCLANNFPDIAKEWDYDKNHPLTPSGVYYSSTKKVWWVCEKHHSFQATVQNRTRPERMTSCPYCSGNKVCDDNCLATINPEVAKWWHPIRNNLSPKDVTPSSHVKAWWLCENGHEFQSPVCVRNNGSKCPLCISSKGQLELYNIIKREFTEYEVIFNYKHLGLRFKNSDRPMEFDIFIPKINLGFEYHGEQHFKQRAGWKKIQDIQMRDQEKRDAAKSHGIYLIEIDHTWDLSEELVLNEIEKFYLNPEW